MNSLQILLLFIVFVSVVHCTGSGQVKKEKWEPFAVSYERIANLEEASAKYNLLIVEPDQYSKAETDSLNNPKNQLIAYITLGEVDRNRWYYPLLEERGFLGVNENWDSPYLNLADSTTRSILLDKVVPNIMSKGFDGLFLDTVDDVAPYTDRAHLQPQMVDIISQIHANYPDAIIIQNAGLFLLDKTKEFIDAVLIEDVATSYDFKNRTYNLKEKQQYHEKVQQIEQHTKAIQKPFLLVDFAEETSLKELAKSRLDTLPYPYFINTIGLNDISKSISSGSVFNTN
ncbi:endo alpha-1,4 polygalactosaminidase [Fodinibius salsisoli]|uniref:Endo alpha-1,4 polygalactosaminidase n=1 Tax=Fodinibius salsisoli TaxID=2820877 RepID=A0ABT3PR17_9BACT|nr:endo alpha-1,4 polygalactosaminidase [Fodinibius salsisoli]MCW9708309.1 endo alpha-1,4 polygalactosaminidase [Fodinibius salsisoli]